MCFLNNNFHIWCVILNGRADLISLFFLARNAAFRKYFYQETLYFTTIAQVICYLTEQRNRIPRNLISSFICIKYHAITWTFSVTNIDNINRALIKSIEGKHTFLYLSLRLCGWHRFRKCNLKSIYTFIIHSLFEATLDE